MNNQILNHDAKHMVIANGLPLCKVCAMLSFKAVSRQYRPLVQQWVVYEDVVYSKGYAPECSLCGK
jgi:hypothetical protein